MFLNFKAENYQLSNCIKCPKFLKMCLKKKNLSKITPANPLKPCVICLQPSLKYTGCNRCKGCRICYSCYSNLKKTNNTKKCPICNLECEKCKTGEDHKNCTWMSKKNFVLETIIDIKPIIPSTPVTINNEPDERPIERKCIKCPSIRYLYIKNTLKAIPICCTFLLLSFFIGIMLISMFNSGLAEDFSLQFALNCMAVGFVTIFLVLCICNSPCCCDYNILTCIKEIYFSDN